MDGRTHVASVAGTGATTVARNAAAIAAIRAASSVREVVTLGASSRRVAAGGLSRAAAIRVAIHAVTRATARAAVIRTGRAAVWTAGTSRASPCVRR